MNYFLVFRNQLDQVQVILLNYFRTQRFPRSNLYKINEGILLFFCLFQLKDKTEQGYAYMYQQDSNRLAD